jgi:hypothetical protein
LEEAIDLSGDRQILDGEERDASPGNRIYITEGRRRLRRRKSRWEDNIKIYLTEIEWGHVLNSFGS